MNIGEALISLGNFCAVRFGLDKVLATKACADGEVQQFAALASLLGEGEAHGLQEAIARIATYCFKHLGEKRVMEITGGEPNSLAGALNLASHLGGVAGVAAGALPGSFTPPAAPGVPTTRSQTPTPLIHQPPQVAPQRDPKFERLKVLAIAIFGLRDIANLLAMVQASGEQYRTLEHLFHINRLTFPGIRSAGELSIELVAPGELDAAGEELRAQRQATIDSMCGTWLSEP